MFKINLDKYFDTLDYVNEINKFEFEYLDLSDFFENLNKDKKIKIKERLSKLNNFNRIYVLSAYETLRDEFDIKLVEKNNLINNE
jgi:hypothetical protein